ncbi:M48 family metalloprotease [Aquicoccus sp.]|uniref:M48 family metalloprotease n=1 Tax=Aquicoccus sp. TaxID=2055851 RepID=UPI003561D1F9
MSGLVSTVLRVREFEADRAAAVMMGTPEDLVSALERLARIAPDKAISRIWPFSIFSSHPAFADRITNLRRMKIPSRDGLTPPRHPRPRPRQHRRMTGNTPVREHLQPGRRCRARSRKIAPFDA